MMCLERYRSTAGVLYMHQGRRRKREPQAGQSPRNQAGNVRVPDAEVQLDLRSFQYRHIWRLSVILMDVLDPESDSTRTCTYVEEADELLEIVHKAVASGGQECGELLPHFTNIVRDW